jgi:TonB family protein
VEYAFRSKWARPENIDDHALVAEYEISIDRSGAIANAVMTKGSGNTKWDDSVKQAIAAVKGVSKAPPTNFPPRVTVRFDVVDTEPIQP